MWSPDTRIEIVFPDICLKSISYSRLHAQFRSGFCAKFFMSRCYMYVAYGKISLKFLLNPGPLLPIVKVPVF